MCYTTSTRCLIFGFLTVGSNNIRNYLCTCTFVLPFGRPSSWLLWFNNLGGMWGDVHTGFGCVDNDYNVGEGNGGTHLGGVIWVGEVFCWLNYLLLWLHGFVMETGWATFGEKKNIHHDDHPMPCLLSYDICGVPFPLCRKYCHSNNPQHKP